MKTPWQTVIEAIEISVTALQSALDDRNVSAVSRATGLHENTIRNLRKGNGGTPSLGTIRILSDYLFPQPGN